MLSVTVRALFGALGAGAAALFFMLNKLPNRVRCLALLLYHGSAVGVHLLAAYLLRRDSKASYRHERIKCLTLVAAFVVTMVGFTLMYVKEQTDLRGAPSMPVPVTAIYFALMVLDRVRLASLLQVQALLALCIAFMEVDLYIETKGTWPVWRDAAACVGLAGLALAATTVLETRARVAYAKRQELPHGAYGAYWRGVLRLA
ncbi:hypothetical protein WJX81_006367 [Elliptochloris bilobata]|uniref:Uncharacterized protein n=1 Tax=Elliptochloris bilobata TaxID=381761 RepID=A0AAW1S268_9CHLO